MKSRMFRPVSIISLFFICEILLTSTAQSVQESKLTNKIVPKNNDWLQLRRALVLFPNLIGVQLLIAHSKQPGTWVASIAPDEKHMVVAEEIDRPYNMRDYYLHDEFGKRIGLLAKDADILQTATWSKSSRYLFGCAIFDMDARKLTDCNEAMKFFEWSLKDDNLVYSSESKFREASIAKIHKSSIVRQKATEQDIINLLGNAYPAALKVAHEAGIWSGLGRGYYSQVYARSLYPSPDGKRVLLQNICTSTGDLVDAPDDVCYYYIVDKNGICVQESKTGKNATVFTQWLDNRYLVGWFHPTNDDYDDNMHYLSSKVQLILWDTDSNRMWKAPFPRHYYHDALLWKLAPLSKSVKKAQPRKDEYSGLRRNLP